MFRADTVNDTTPEVAKFVHSLRTAPRPAEFPPIPHVASASESDTAHDGDVCGHVLLTSLPRVTALARRRQLLRIDVPPDVSSSSAPSSADSPSSLLVRLVLSLLAPAAAEATLSPTTSADERDVDTAGQAASPGGEGFGSPSSSAATPTGSASTAALPWCSPAPTATDTAEDVYRVQCIESHLTTTADSTRDEDTDGVDDAVDAAAALQCGLAIRSYPVAVLTQESVVALSRFWHGNHNNSTALEAAAATREDENLTTTPMMVSEAPSSVNSCVHAALAAFRFHVRLHEEKALRSLGRMCADLLGRLDAIDSASDAAPTPQSPSLLCSGWVIDVPIYGVSLSVEDNQATRLERVAQLTTPLLQESTGQQSMLCGLTAVLQQLRAWSTESRSGPPTVSSPSVAAAATNTTQQGGDVSLSESVGGLSGTSPPRVLRLSRSRLVCLSSCIAQLLEQDLVSPPSGLGAAAAALPVMRAQERSTCSADSLLRQSRLRPACVVHCQLGVSRSPSVVMLFYMHRFHNDLRRAVEKRSRLLPSESTPSATSADTTETTTRERRFVEEASVSPAGQHAAVEAAVDVFHGLLSALRRARPRVKPNVCFAVQLLSYWKKRMAVAQPVSE